MEKAIESRMGADIATQLQDALHLALCGAGGPMPDPNAYDPCAAVVAGKQLFLVDACTWASMIAKEQVLNFHVFGWGPVVVKRYLDKDQLIWECANASTARKDRLCTL